jgi:hypothetical protein
MGKITVKYNGSTTVPVNAGAYSVTVDIAEDTNFGPVTGLELGKFTIKKITPTEEHLVFELTDIPYDRKEHAVSVTMKTDYDGMGKITVKYNGLEEVPVNAGEYTVTVDIAGGTNFNAVTELELGKFTITKVTLTIRPKQGQSKVYGEVDPIFIFDALGLQNGETAKITGQLGRTNDSEDVGEYAIDDYSALALIDNGDFKASNYVLNFDNTVLFEIFAAFETKAELISLSIDGKPIKINPESENELEYTAPCDKTEVSLDIKYSDKAKITLTVNGTAIDSKKILSKDATTVTITDLQLSKDVTTVTIKIVSEDNKHNSVHNLHIYRSFPGDRLIFRRWEDVIAVNANPKNNGGYTIEGFRWHFKTDSAKVFSTEQFLSIDPESANDYHVKISIDGRWHRVCGVPEWQNTSNITAYPNPVTIGENLTLKLPVEFVDGRMDVISISGTVMKRNIPLPNTQTDLSFHDLPSGVYMLKVTSIKGNSETVKIIIGN